MLFDGKTVLVTGGSSGIGLVTALGFARENANVIICGRDTGRGEAALKKLQIGGGKKLFIRCDVSSQSDVDGLFNRIEKDFPALDFAVNSAGISRKGKLIVDFSEADYNETMDINVKGLLFCMQREIRIMRKKRFGVVVNLGSLLGVRANNSTNALYTVSKHAVTGLTREAALEYAAEGIRVNAVLPSYTETEIIKDHLEDPEKRRRIEGLHPIKRIIQPEEVAHAIMFLCEDRSAALTGVLLPVDGGIMAM